ncbi:MAG TPA: ABC transporter [Ruminococcaceae bacterium]|nr:ABC transporter [Oscillospiraceae bacterium]
MSYLNRYMKRYRIPFFAALAFLTLEALCDLIQPAVMSRVVDVGIRNRDMSYVLHMGFIMLGITGVGAIGAVGRNILSSVVSQHFAADLRMDLYKKIQTLSYAAARRFDTGSLVTRLTNDVTQLVNFANGLMRIFAKAPILCAGSIIMAILLDPPAGLVLVAVVPCVAVIILIEIRRGYPLFSRVQSAVDALNEKIRTYLQTIRVVKAFNRFKEEKGRFEEKNTGLCKAQAHAMKTMALFSPSVLMVVNLGIVVVLWMGGLRVNSGALEVGKVIAFLNYMTQISFALTTVFMVFVRFVRARASAERVGEVMNAEDTMKEPVSPISLKKKTSLRFSHVSFSYKTGGEDRALKDISFSCDAGQTVGILGSTGSGKSTLVNLIPRFYDSTAGSIEVCGVDIQQANTEELRKNVAMVPQKSTLFSGTILENLRWGDQNATLEQVQEASNIAQAHEFISNLPNGYETYLGQGGVNLSGGQKQRLAIARALLRHPRIFILDDCTSAVDALTEKKIRAGLSALPGAPICIVIAQRIASVMQANRILAMEDGKVVGSGTHQELLKSCMTYRDICASQSGRVGA